MNVIKQAAKSTINSFGMVTSLVELSLKNYDSRKLEIGSGPVKKEGWITLDACLGADVCWNLKRSLPFPNGRFEMVYCSHVLEHFSHKELIALLTELYRILIPDGILSVCVPDASVYIDLYNLKKSGKEFTRYEKAFISDKPMDILNYMFYMNGHHKHMFDEENLLYHLSCAGFTDCRTRGFDSSLDMIERHYESLYVQCQKPKR